MSMYEKSSKQKQDFLFKSSIMNKFITILKDKEQTDQEKSLIKQQQKEMISNQEQKFDQGKILQIFENYKMNKTFQNGFKLKYHKINDKIYNQSQRLQLTENRTNYIRASISKKMSLYCNTQRSQDTQRKDIFKEKKSQLSIIQLDALKKDIKMKNQREREYQKKCQKYSSLVLDFLNQEILKYNTIKNKIMKQSVLNQLIYNISFILDKFNQFQNNLNSFYNICKENNNQEVKFLQQMMPDGFEHNIYQQFVQSLFFFLIAKLFQILENYDESIKYFKQAKNYVKIYKNNSISKLKLRCYKGLGYVFKKVSYYTLSKHYFFKYLQFSLIVNDFDSELKAYDQIGIVYMYLNQISASKFYHEKAIKGECEPKNSSLRQKCIQNLNLYVLFMFQHKEKEKVQPLNSVQAKYLNYSSDESIKVPISEINQMDNYDTFNIQQQMRQTDLYAFLKKVKKTANLHIRQTVKVEPDENQNQEEQQQNSYYKTYLGHLSKYNESSNEFIQKQKKNQKGINFVKKPDNNNILQKILKINIGFNNLKNGCEQFLKKLQIDQKL